MMALLLIAMPSISFAKDNILIVSSQGKAFEEVITGLKNNFNGDVNFEVYIASRQSKLSEFELQMSKRKPKSIVLIGNSSVTLYQKYQTSHPTKHFPPSISVAVLYVDMFMSRLKNATAIRYEVPLVTSAVNLQSILTKDIKKVGVVHRKWMDDFIKRNAEYCRSEGIELVSISIGHKERKQAKHLKKGLHSLLRQKIDAIWVLSDNALLNRDMIGSAWLPVLAKAKLPVIVGIKPLMSTRFNLGNFASVIEHHGLGKQTASILGKLMKDNWKLNDLKVQEPTSIKNIVNLSILNSHKIKYIQDKVNAMDEVIID